MNDKDKQQVYDCIRAYLVLGTVPLGITILSSFQLLTSNNADILLGSGLKLSGIIINLCSELCFLESVNTKNVMTSDIIYSHLLHCMIKPWPYLESTH